VDSSLAQAAADLQRARLTDTLNSQIAARPSPDEIPPKILKFGETVEVLPTFRKTEYNRKPDSDATFRKLTPRMKMEIREELNNFKRNEMSVHETSASNTAFH
jgi:phosphatase and actin regulator 4